MAKKLTATTGGIRRRASKKQLKGAPLAALPKELAGDAAANMLLRSLKVHQRRSNGLVDAQGLKDVIRQSRQHGKSGGDFVMHMCKSVEFDSDAKAAASMILRAEEVVKEKGELSFDAVKDLVARGRGEKAELDDTGCEALSFVGERHDEAITDPRVRTFFQSFTSAFAVDVIENRALDSYLDHQRDIQIADEIREADYKKADIIRDEVDRAARVKEETSNYNMSIENVKSRRDAFEDRDHVQDDRVDEHHENKVEVRQVLEAPVASEGETIDVISQVRNERDDARDQKVRFNRGENVTVADEDD